MERLESDWLGGQRDVFLTVLCPVVCDRKKEASGGADRVLVAEPDWLLPPALLRPVLQKRFRVHLCVRVHLDSLHPQPRHSSATQTGAIGLSRLRDQLPTAGQLLRQLRVEICPVMVPADFPLLTLDRTECRLITLHIIAQATFGPSASSQYYNRKTGLKIVRKL